MFKVDDRVELVCDIGGLCLKKGYQTIITSVDVDDEETPYRITGNYGYIYWVSDEDIKLVDNEVTEEGGTKNDTGKPRIELVDPSFIFGVAEVLTFGANKYADNNWRKGFKWTRLMGAIMRHCWAWLWGQDRDPETGISHLYHAACGLMFLSTFQAEERYEDDDRVKYNNELSDDYHLTGEYEDRLEDEK